MNTQDAYTIQRKRGDYISYWTGDSWAENPRPAYRFLTSEGANTTIRTLLPKKAGESIKVLTVDDAYNLYYGWVTSAP